MSLGATLNPSIHLPYFYLTLTNSLNPPFPLHHLPYIYLTLTNPLNTHPHNITQQ